MNLLVFPFAVSAYSAPLSDISVHFSFFLSFFFPFFFFGFFARAIPGTATEFQTANELHFSATFKVWSLGHLQFAAL